jgi:hypothetical protein
MAKVFLGNISTDFDAVTLPSALFKEASAALDAQAEQRRQAEAAIVDARRTNTRRARAASRFRKALNVVMRRGVR